NRNCSCNLLHILTKFASVVVTNFKAGFCVAFGTGHEILKSFLEFHSCVAFGDIKGTNYFILLIFV
ncbi:hypothetical protein ACH5RR_006764, partial [Cinchona calisaya]